MNYPKILVSLLILFTVFQLPLMAQQKPEKHTVRQGETLSSISREYNVSVGQLLRWNQLSDAHVSVGQVIRLAPPASDNQVSHIVEPGQTLYAISRAYGVTIAEIQEWNNISSTNIEVGRELVLYPPETQTPVSLPPASRQTEEQSTNRESIVQAPGRRPGNTYYTVKSGDTLTKIAREHDMSVSELRDLNNLEGDMISVGQQLTVRETRSAPSVSENSEESTPQGKFVIYRTKQGESGPDILRKFEMSETEFNALNPGIDINRVSSGQQITVLLPPTRTFKNPFREGATLENLGSVPVVRYPNNMVAQSTTSGELYNPDQLTAAHSNMALGNVIYVENPATGKGIYVRINDRQSEEGLKLSHKAFEMLGFADNSRGQATIYLDN